MWCPGIAIVSETIHGTCPVICAAGYRLLAPVNAVPSHVIEFSAGVKRNGPLCVEIDGLTIDRMSVGKPREDRAV